MADRALTQLLSVPSNRSCADCKAALVDTLQIYASFSSPTPSTIHRRPTLDLSLASFQKNHQVLCPIKQDEEEDPLFEHSNSMQYGVFVCAPCAAAHALTTSIVKPVHEATAWNDSDISWFQSMAGNAKANSILERYGTSRPNSASSVSERLEFCRAKYHALEFCLPKYGPLARDAWLTLMQSHPEWEDHTWGSTLLEGLQTETAWNVLQSKSLMDRSSTIQQLPKQLIDYFCVVGASGHPPHKSERIEEEREFQDKEQQIPLVPTVVDCYPKMDTKTFPNAIATFCFPDKCYAHTTAVPPTFFTQVLTNATGQRIYAAILCVHDPNDKGLYVPKCLVLLSHYAFFDLFRKILLQLNRIALTEAPLPMERFIANLFEVPLPPRGKTKVRFGFTASDIWEISRPPPNQLPMVNFSFEPLFACLSIPNIITVIGCLLSETKVALLSQHTSLLCPVAEALLHLLFPFHWCGLYIPVLPYYMLELLEAPVPYLLGIHSRYLRHPKRCRSTVYVHLDEDTVHLGCDDSILDSLQPRQIPQLPDRLATKLRWRLVKAVGNQTYCSPGRDRITTGGELKQEVVDREGYLQRVNYLHDDLRSRRDVLGNIDKAYKDNEWLVPIHGFLSESGQFHSKEPLKQKKRSTPKNRAGGKKFHIRSLRGSNVSEAASSHHSTAESQTSATNAQESYNRSLHDMMEPVGFSSEQVRDSFLRFFVSLLADYRLYLALNGFRTEEFVDSQPVPDRDFMNALVQTQLFECFVVERRECPEDPEVRFFDESITAKFNRSKMVLARGGKKDTPFLDDGRYEFKETFSPPPPSNWGLPDNGNLYHYSTFPKLKQNLFGKVRAPRPLENENDENVTNSIVSVLRRRRSAYGALNNSFAVQRTKFFKPKESFDAAMKTLKAPFNGRKVGMTINTPDGTSHSTSSDLSLDGPFDLTDGDITEDHIAGNARRRQIILVGIITRFQASCRSYLIRQRKMRLEHGKEMLKSRAKSGTVCTDVAAMVIQARYRSKMQQTRLRRMRMAAARVSAFHRGNWVRTLFRTVRTAVTRVQASCRGLIARRRLYYVFVQRMELYRQHMFVLWQLSDTPLLYRSVFWSYLEINKPYKGYVRVALAEDELQRLWKCLQLASSPIEDINCPYHDQDMEKRLNNAVFAKCSAVRKVLDSGEVQSILKARNGLAKSAADCVLAERTQVYEKLSRMSSGDADAVFRRLSISHNEKKKKATIAQSLCKSIAHCTAHLTMS